MLTRQGWLLLAGAAGVLVAGRVFGIIELYVIGAAAALLVVASLVYVRAARARLRVARTVSPSRVHAGDATRVEVAATNRSPRRTPVLRLRDPVGGTRGALLNLAPLRAGETARAAYRLPTAQRGVVRVGPLTVVLSDPFGLAMRAVPAAPLIEVTVYPRVDVIPPPQGGGDRDPHGVAIHQNAVGRQGEDFYAIREYVVGDDLRRVHWKSTARTDELQVRQDEMPWQDRTTVVLDVRRGNHDGPSFERAISATASALVACTRAGHQLRLMTTDGTDSGHAGGLLHTEGLLEYLARVELDGVGTLRQEIGSLAGTHQGGVLVVVLGRTATPELEAVARLRQDFRSVVIVLTRGPVPGLPAVARAVSVVDATADGTLPRAWANRLRSERMAVAR